MKKPESTKKERPHNPKAQHRSKTRIDLEAFSENKLIQKIGEDPYWTFSDDNKKPLNARRYIDTKDLTLFRMEDEEDISNLVTLDELQEDKDLKYVNRTYRFHNNSKRRNPLICIDVEKTASEGIVQKMMQMPIHYAEYSKSGGLHLLIEVPRNIITKEMNYLFNLTVFKDASGDLEIIFNRHFCTFTRKVIPTRPVDYSSETTPDSQQLRDFLKYIVKLDAKRQKIREETQRIALTKTKGYDMNNLPSHVEALINIIPKDYIEYLKNLSLSDFEYDESKFEISIAGKVAGKMYGLVEESDDPFLSSLLTVSPMDLDLWDYAYATFAIIKEIIPERPKHHEKREGLDWLLYLSRNSSRYIKSQRQKA